MKHLIFLFLLLPSLAFAETKVTGNEVSGISNSSSTVVLSPYVVSNTTYAGNTCVTGSTLTVVSSGGRFLTGYTSVAFSGGVGVGAWVSMKIDGVAVATKDGLARTNIQSANVPLEISFTYMTPPLSVGSHTFCVDAKQVAGAYNLNYGSGSGDIDSQFWVMELK